MMLLLVLLFILVPIVELYVIIQVGEAIGVWWTIALLLLDSLLGAWLMRTQGRAAWRRFNAALSEGRAPTREVLDGVLIVFGGALLITPGFISDIFGALLLLPPTRALIRRLLVRRITRRGVGAAWTMSFGRRGGRGGPTPPPAARGFDVESTATEIHPDQRQLP